jgi:MraZ protein
MLMIFGEYEHTIDEKNRLFISNKLRSQIDAETYGSDFYLAIGPNGILCLYPEKCFQQIALAGAPGMGAPDESVAYERLSFALAGKAELDRQGRLLINDKLRKRAGLGTNLTLVGVRDHIEIWNTEDWDQYVEAKLSQFTNQMAQSRHVLIERHAREMELKGEKP